MSNRSFFARDTHLVARELLGKILVRSLDGKKLTGRITEVESYVGEDDLACHASRGRTPRTEIMYGAPGHTYVYLIYGMYHCMNIVTESPGFPAAVLIRALEPLSGVETMAQARRTAAPIALTTGPGKLTQALGITTALRGEDLTTSNQLYVADDGYVPEPAAIATSPRIGVEYAGTCAQYPWRYYLRHSPYLSRPHRDHSK